MPTNGVLFWARQALNVNNSAPGKMKSQQTCAEHMNMQWMHSLAAGLAWLGLAWLGLAKMMLMSCRWQNCGFAEYGSYTSYIQYIHAADMKSMCCSEVTFYPLAQIEGSHDLIAYTAAIEHAGIRIRINMKRFWARSNTYGPSVSHPGWDISRQSSEDQDEYERTTQTTMTSTMRMEHWSSGSWCVRFHYQNASGVMTRWRCCWWWWWCIMHEA